MTRSDDVSPSHDAPLVLRVQIRGDDFLYEGDLELVEEGVRLDGLLNQPEPFLALTNVLILDGATGKTFATPHLVLNKGAITHVVRVADGLEDGELAPDDHAENVADDIELDSGMEMAPQRGLAAQSGGGTMSAPAAGDIAGVDATTRAPIEAIKPSAVIEEHEHSVITAKVPAIPRKLDSPTQPFVRRGPEPSELDLDDEEESDDISPDDLLGASGGFGGIRRRE